MTKYKYKFPHDPRCDCDRCEAERKAFAEKHKELTDG